MTRSTAHPSLSVRLRLAALALGVLLGASPTPSLAATHTNPELVFHRGIVAFGDERYDQARAAFEEVLAADPEDTSSLQYLALIAHAEGQPDRAIALYRQALAIDPDDIDIRLDLGITLLETDEIEAARAEFDQVLAIDPTRSRAQLMAGIAAYRAGDYTAALPHLDAAASDPGLHSEARYYTGLCQVLLRRYELADGAFSDVAGQVPITPLGESARQLREQMRENPDGNRRWWLAMSVGLEGDSNPTVAGAPLARDADGRVVLRPQAEFTLWERQGDLISIGYDGYVSFHFHEQEVDLNTQGVFLQGTTTLGPVSATLRYDYAATWIELSEPFRQIHRLIPTVSFPLGDIGVTQIYYQYVYHDFENVLVRALDRSGNQSVIAVNHFFFLDTDRVDYLRIGALGDFYDAKGSDYPYQGWEVSFGAAAPLPFDISAIALYRYIERYYRFPSIFQPNVPRDDSINRLSLDFVRPVGKHWEVSVNGIFNWVDSNIPAYDFDRFIGGAYVTYVF